MKAVIVLNHNPVEELIKDLKENYDIKEVIILTQKDNNIKQQFANIPFSKKEMLQVAGDIYYDIMQYIPDIVVISGEVRVCRFVVNTLSCDKIRCYTPYSQRISEDVKQSDGSVKKVSTFKYVGLVEY